MKKLTPYDFGKLAFEKGMKCIPAMDKEFLDIYIKGLVGGKGKRFIKQWIKGWTEANLVNLDK